MLDYYLLIHSCLNLLKFVDDKRLGGNASTVNQVNVRSNAFNVTVHISFLFLRY